jgi:hypothetical protein
MPINGDKYAFAEKNVNKSPEEHGVYQLLDGDVTIYYGRASGDGVPLWSNRISRFPKGIPPNTRSRTGASLAGIATN